MREFIMTELTRVTDARFNRIMELDALYRQTCGTKGQRAKFINCDLQERDFESKNLSHVDFTGSDLRHARLTFAILHGTNFTNTNLAYTAMYGVHICETVFEGTELIHADLGAALFHRSGPLIKPIYVDVERNYLLQVITNCKDGPRFFAGCRNFTYGEAMYHWGPTCRPQPTYIKAIQKYILDLPEVYCPTLKKQIRQEQETKKVVKLNLQKAARRTTSKKKVSVTKKRKR